MEGDDTPRRQYIIGVDVGGTNTDSVLLDATRTGTDAVLAWNKTVTASNVTAGVKRTLEKLLQYKSSTAENIAAVTVGTTHFLNAIVEHDASRLEKVAVVRLASYNFTGQTPPFVDWPAGLRGLVEGHSSLVPGGVNIDGTKIADIDAAALLEQADIINTKGIRSVVIVGIGSPMDVDYKQEEEARRILRGRLGEDVDIVCSRDIAGPDILARENASILNASIVKFARRTIRNFLRAMSSLGLNCPLYLTSNTGHLISFTEAKVYPIRIFSSGATNSIRGAAWLAESQLPHEGAVVVDIGGTTTDVGSILQNGYPRLSSSWTEIAGVKVNLEVLQVDSLGLGGGSIVHEDGNGKVSIGPESVGHELTVLARCFGGDTPTATDIAVASDANVGANDPGLSPALKTRGQNKIKIMLENLIDRVKNSPDPCTLILVGGGSILCPPRLEGVNRIIIPKYAGVANAIGAAIAQICGRAERKVNVSDVETARQQVKDQALADAESHGGVAGTAIVTKDSVVGVPYVDHMKTVSVEVACSADHSRFYQYCNQEMSFVSALDEETEGDGDFERKDHATVKEQETASPDFETYRPSVDSAGRWSLSKLDLRFLADGCYILGCGGGGSPYNVSLQLLNLLEQGKSLTIVDASYFGDAAVLAPLCSVGSPAVGLERPGGDLVLHAMQTMEKEIGHGFDGALAVEVGGANGLIALAYGSSQYYNIPCVDGDLMGRAYPNFEKVTPYVHSNDINKLLPVTLSSGTGENVVVPAGVSGVKEAEATIRDVVVTMGSAAGSVGATISGAEMRQFGILNSHSLAWRLGRAMSIARKQGRVYSMSRDIIQEFGGDEAAKVLFRGKIISVEHNLSATAHSTGTITLQKLSDDEITADPSYTQMTATKIMVEFVNENLSVKVLDGESPGEYLALVPDLIFLLDVGTGEAVGTPEYGLKVDVMAAAPHHIWTTKRGIEVGGPSGFGMDVEYKPELRYFPPKSVIEEFRPSARTCFAGTDTK
ncbi:hypothetical protein KEM54_001413 [Ascosphaera aggregata]|nr:hypothetical protein KEM54_001413 [Ascosphaera aggregata]